MVIYFIIGILILIIGIITTGKGFCKNQEKYVLFFEYLVLVVISAIRYQVGMDYQNYLNIYYNYPITRVNEKGYLLINDFIVENGIPVFFIIALYSFITITIAFMYMKRESTDKFLSVAIFALFSQFYLNSMNAIRQSLAIYIFMYSLKYIKEKRPFKYMSAIFIAMFFGHMSSIVLIPLYFILNRKYSLKIKIVFMILLISSYRVILWVAGHTRYAFYLSIGNGQAEIPALLVFELAISLMLAVGLRNNDEINLNRNVNILFLGFAIFSIINRKTVLGGMFIRILLYFTPIIIVLIPDYIKNIKCISNRRLYRYAALFGLSMIYIVAVVLHGERNHLVPYQTFFALK